MTFTAEQPASEVETCDSQTLALTSQDTWTETAVIGSAETILSNLQDLFQTNETSPTFISEVATGKFCTENTWIDEGTSHTLEECAAKVGDIPTGCENGQGIFAW